MASQPDLVALFECPICFESYRDPRILTCGHQFCLQCLTPLVKTHGNQKEVVCPSCRGKTKLDRQGVAGLARPVLMNEIQDKLSQLTMSDPCLNLSQDPPPPGHAACDVEMWLCNGCQRPATYYCYQCQKRLCKLCREKHSRVPKFYTHRCVTILPGLFCSAHSGDAVTEYCHQCKTGICSTCLMDNHVDHNTADLLTLSELKREQLLRFVEKHQAKLTPVSPETLSRIESTIMRVNSNRQRFQNKMRQISESLKEFVDILGKTAAELDSKVDTDLGRMSAITSVLVDSEAGIAATRRELASAHWLLSATTDAELVRGSKELLNRVEKMREVPDLPKTVTISKPEVQEEFWTLVDSIKSLIKRVPVTYKEETINIHDESYAELTSSLLEYDTEKLKQELAQAVDMETLVKQVANRPTPDRGSSPESGGAAAQFGEDESSLSAAEASAEHANSPLTPSSKRTAKRKRQRAKKKAQANSSGEAASGGDLPPLPHPAAADPGLSLSHPALSCYEDVFLPGVAMSDFPTLADPQPNPEMTSGLEGAAAGSEVNVSAWATHVTAPTSRFAMRVADINTQATNFCLDKKHKQVVLRVGLRHAPIKVYSYDGVLVHQIEGVHELLHYSIDRGMCVDTKRDLYVFASESGGGAVVRVKWDAKSGATDVTPTREDIMDVAYSEELDRYYVTQLLGREIMVYHPAHMLVMQRYTPDVDPTDFPIDLGHGFPFYVSTGVIHSRPVLLVNDYHSGAICVLDLTQDGELLKRYGEYGMESDEMINPMSAAVDHQGRLVVVDNGNGRLVSHWSDSRGHHHKVLMKEETCTKLYRTRSPPLAVGIDTENKIMGLNFSEYDECNPSAMRIILFKLED